MAIGPSHASDRQFAGRESSSSLSLVRTIRRIAQRPRLAGGFTVVAIFVVVAVFAPLLAPYDPLSQDLGATLQAPSSEHYFGTDQLGRDILSRVIYGARTSLIVAGVAVAAATMIGTAIGLSAGLIGGWVDNILMGVVEVVMAFPFILLAIVLVSWLGPSQTNTVIALAATAWVAVARIVRAQVLQVKAMVFIDAAVVIGCSPLRIALRHILPQMTSVLSVLVTVEVSRMMLLEGSLSFLGLGVPLPDASWGNMLNEGKNYLSIAWWVVVFPAGCFTIAVLALNQLGDGLRDLADPRLRRR